MMGLIDNSVVLAATDSNSQEEPLLSSFNTPNTKSSSFRPDRSSKTKRKSGDALFNNIDVYYQEFDRYDVSSNVHCIGRDLMDPILNTNYSWMFRSCQFRRLCLDTESNEFVLLDRSSGNRHHPDNNNQQEEEQEEEAVAIGAINPRWSGRGFNKGFHKVKWFPKWINSKQPPQQQQQQGGGGYYELPDDVVMIPFHSMAAHNVGHLMWDDFYPIYTLLSLFDYITTRKSNKNFQYLLLRWSPEKKLYATCDIRPNKRKQCQENFQRFLPLLGVDPDTFSTVKRAVLQPKPNTAEEQQPLKSTLVCSKQAVAGIGMLMDHGMRDHGWTLRDPKSGLDLVPHNIGRGAIFREFRDFMVANMGFPIPSAANLAEATSGGGGGGDDDGGGRNKITISTHSSHNRPNMITFSTHSSRGFERSLSFENQTAAIRRALRQQDSEIVVQNITLKELSLHDQIQVALESAIFVTVCGGGAVTATFLPPGSTLIVYFAEDGGFDFWDYNYTFNLPKYNHQPHPARLDWDLLTNAAHLKVHWLPMKTMETTEDIKVLEQLVLHELDTMGLL